MSNFKFISLLIPDTIKRFWAKVNKTNNCWLWTASTRNKGYGAFTYRLNNGVIVQDRAHRFSYRLHIGEIPDGIMVLHSCDTPACVNPDHLFLGTNQDNVNDMMSKGRHVKGGTYTKGYEGKYKRGEKHFNAKLTKAKVLHIRQLYLGGAWSYSELARVFGVSEAAIEKIIKRKNWKHI